MKTIVHIKTRSRWLYPQGVGAACVDSRCVALWWRGVPEAHLALHWSAAQTGALGRRVQAERVQEHLVSAAGGEVQPRVPAAEGEVQGHGQGEVRSVSFQLLGMIWCC